MAITDYLKHVRDELQHVAWPSTRTAIAHTLVVVLISAAIALFIGLIDFGLRTAVTQVVGI